MICNYYKKIVGITLLGLLSCTPTKSDSSDNITQGEQGISDTSSNDIDNDNNSVAYWALTINTSAGEIWGYSEDGGYEVIFGPFHEDTRIVHYVAPGTWWVYAADTELHYCDKSSTEKLGPGDALNWTVSTFPYSMDKSGDCLAP